MKQRGFPLRLKRLLDVAVGGAAALVAGPVVAVAAAAIVVTDGRPAFFVQTRPGRDGRPFPFFKLRTMRSDPKVEGKPEFDGARMTPIGTLLRKASIDELPQLWNVLRGDMSLVGPRPLLMDYLDRYTAEQRRRHDVLPGITGWAAVHGRNAQSWDEKFERDLWYVDHWSPWLDVKILARTVAVVLGRKNVASEGHVTSPAFDGDRAR